MKGRISYYLTFCLIFCLGCVLRISLAESCISTDDNCNSFGPQPIGAESTIFLGRIGNHDITLIANETKLSISIEDAQRLNKYSKLIGKQDYNIKQITNQICETPLELFNVLKAAIEGYHPELSLELDTMKMLLTYKLIQKFPFPKTIKFDIPLQSDQIDQNTRIKYMLDKYFIIETHPIFIPSSQFIKVSDNRTTAQKMISNGWYGILCEPKLYFKGRQKFSLKILSTSHAHIMVGVALSSTDLSRGAYTEPTAWLFNLDNYHSYNHNQGRHIHLQAVRPSANDIITVIIDVDTMTMGIEHNGFALGPAARLNLKENDVNNLYPVVALHHIGDTVELVQIRQKLTCERALDQESEQAMVGACVSFFPKRGIWEKKGRNGYSLVSDWLHSKNYNFSSQGMIPALRGVIPLSMFLCSSARANACIYGYTCYYLHEFEPCLEELNHHSNAFLPICWLALDVVYEVKQSNIENPLLWIMAYGLNAFWERLALVECSCK